MAARCMARRALGAVGRAIPGLARRALIGAGVMIPTLLRGLNGAALAQAPPEVLGLDLNGPSTLSWSAAPGATSYHVYRGLVSGLSAGIPGRCHGYRVVGTTYATPEAPDAGAAYFYLVTGESASGAEGTAGNTLVGRAARAARPLWSGDAPARPEPGRLRLERVEPRPDRIARKHRRPTSTSSSIRRRSARRTTRS